MIWVLGQLLGTALVLSPSLNPQPDSQLLVFCFQLVGLPKFCALYPRGQDGKGMGFCGPKAWLHLTVLQHDEA